MAKCVTFSSEIDQFIKVSFSDAGFKSSTTDLGDGTVIHIWVPITTTPTKPNLLLIHGLGVNSMYHFYFISNLHSHFNLYIPDLVFFGDSHTTRPDRSEEFQAQCVMSTMARLGVTKMNVAGSGYGGHVGYSMAAQYPEAVERVVVFSSDISMESIDFDNGLFTMKTMEEMVDGFLAQTREKLREFTKASIYKPFKFLPNFIANNYAIDTKYLQERKELLEALYKDRKLCNLPKITQPTLIIWGQHDQIFPVELGHRLKSHLGANAQLMIANNLGHSANMSMPSEVRDLSFLLNHPKKKTEKYRGCWFFQGL